MTEKLIFPSEDWIKEYCSMLSSSADYNKLGKGWQDPIQFKITDLEKVQASIDFKSFVLEVKDGRCEGYRLIRDDSDSAPFVLSSAYSDLKRTLEGKVNPPQAMLNGSLKVKGNMMLLMKYAAAATEMVKVAGKIETEFIV